MKIASFTDASGVRRQQLLGSHTDMRSSVQADSTVRWPFGVFQAGGVNYRPYADLDRMASVPNHLERVEVARSILIPDTAMLPTSLAPQPYAWRMLLNADDPPTAGSNRTQLNTFSVRGEFEINLHFVLDAWEFDPQSEMLLLQAKQDGNAFGPRQAGGYPTFGMRLVGNQLIFDAKVNAPELTTIEADGFASWGPGDRHAAISDPIEVKADTFYRLRVRGRFDPRQNSEGGQGYFAVDLDGARRFEYSGPTQHPASRLTGNVLDTLIALCIYEYKRPVARRRSLLFTLFELLEAS